MTAKQAGAGTGPPNAPNEKVALGEDGFLGTGIESVLKLRVSTEAVKPESRGHLALAARGLTDVGEFFACMASEARHEPDRIIEILKREGLL